MAVQDIYLGLQHLSDSVAVLENLVVAREHAAQQKTAAPAKTLTQAQIDMFSGWTGNAQSKVANDKAAIFAKKLDSTIDRVQALLAEAGGY